jgi:hypothetical protein
MWAQIEPMLLSAIQILVPALVGLAVAWIQRRRARLEIAREVVRELDPVEAPGAEKKAQAVALISQRTGAFTRMPEAVAASLIETVLPEVRRQSAKPDPKDRRSVEVKFPSNDG